MFLHFGVEVVVFQHVQHKRLQRFVGYVNLYTLGPNKACQFRAYRLAHVHAVQDALCVLVTDRGRRYHVPGRIQPAVNAFGREYRKIIKFTVRRYALQFEYVPVFFVARHYSCSFFQKV